MCDKVSFVAKGVQSERSGEPVDRQPLVGALEQDCFFCCNVKEHPVAPFSRLAVDDKITEHQPRFPRRPMDRGCQDGISMNSRQSVNEPAFVLSVA